MPTRELPVALLRDVRHHHIRHKRAYLPAAELLAQTGQWSLVARQGAYGLLQPLNGAAPKIRARVPKPEDLLRFAEELEQRGEPWHGDFKGWPARFTPETSGRFIDNGSDFEQPGRLEVGVPGIWRAVCEWGRVWVSDARTCAGT